MRWFLLGGQGSGHFKRTLVQGPLVPKDSWLLEGRGATTVLLVSLVPWVVWRRRQRLRYHHDFLPKALPSLWGPLVLATQPGPQEKYILEALGHVAWHSGKKVVSKRSDR